MFWEMRLRPRQWLTRGNWKQLAPDDAYLSCEYSLSPGDGLVVMEESEEKRANTGWQIMTFDVSISWGPGGWNRGIGLTVEYSDERGCRYAEE